MRLPPSLWADGEDITPRASLPGPLEVDIAIVGAGFTGLWTAYYLRRSDPSLRVAVVESEVAGFGASGRNGGWCSALFPTPWSALVRTSSASEALRLHQAMQETVREVGRVCAAEGIDAGYHRGGTVEAARTPEQLRRVTAAVAEARSRGFAPEDHQLLDASEAREMLAADGVLGAGFTPHCARIHPFRLVRGLAEAVERAGATIYEHTPVTDLGPGWAQTPAGRVRADVVVRATEGYTPRLPGQRRAIAPVYSLMVATEPLPSEVWDRIGLADRQTFTDARHLVIYGQRTVDDRIAFGGRGAPYHWRSHIKAANDSEPRVFAALHRTLRDLLPGLGDAQFTHAWGGPLGIPRDWSASVGLDRGTGLGWAGGYVGDGVGTTNLAGRTLADLVTGTDSDLVSLPWVQHHSPFWEPEPLRWLGINAGLQAMSLADAEEQVTGRGSVLARAMAPLIGGH